MILDMIHATHTDTYIYTHIDTYTQTHTSIDDIYTGL